MNRTKGWESIVYGLQLYDKSHKMLELHHLVRALVR